MSGEGLPKPQEPQAPDASECCGSGCLRCVFDVHAEALQRHDEAMTAWQAQQQAGRIGSGDPQA